MNQSLKESIKILIKNRHATPFPSFKPREIGDMSLDRFHNILAIIGPRRAGKTYFMYQIADHLIKNGLCQKEDILFLDFEHVWLIELQTGDISLLIQLYYELYGKKPKYIFFDEIQHIKNRGRVLRSFHNDTYEIVVSGSSSKLLLTEISSELRGRYTHKLMLPFSFSELLDYHSIDLQTIEHTYASGSLLKIFDEYSTYGGFPKILASHNVYEKRQEIEEYYRTIYYRDLVERHRIQDTYVFELLMKYVLNMYSSIVVPSKFAQYAKSMGIDISKPTVLKYLSYLKEGFFIIECQKFGWSPRVSIANPKKVYLIDPGFVQLAHNFSENKGKILENIVAIHLFRHEQDFYYFDEGKECDFIIKHKFAVSITYAIQVTRILESHNQDREIAGLMLAMDVCGLQEGYILTYNQFDSLTIQGKKIHVLPVWKRLLARNFFHH